MKKIIIIILIIILIIIYSIKQSNINQIGDLPSKITRDLLENTQIISNTLSEEIPIANIDEVDEYSLQLFAFHNLENSLTNIITKEEMDKVLNQYIDKANINYQNIICPLDNLVTYEYNQSTELFNYIDQHDHGAVFPILNNKVYLLDSYQDEDKFIIEVHILFGELNTGYTGEPSKYYINGENAINREDELFEITESKNLAYNYEKIKATLPIYKVSYIKQENNYLLQSIIEKQ